MTLPRFVSNVTATDLTGRRVKARRVPIDITMGSFVEGLLPRLQLPSEDPAGRALNYHARVDRLGRHAHASEIVGEVLVPNDQITLHPNVDAGAR